MASKSSSSHGGAKKKTHFESGVTFDEKEVTFKAPFKDYKSFDIHMNNAGCDTRICFKVKGNCRRNFSVNPVYGFMDVKGAATVTVSSPPLQNDWISPKHRITIVFRKAPTHGDLEVHDAAGAWVMGKPWSPRSKQTQEVDIPVKYVCENGISFGGVATGDTAHQMCASGKRQPVNVNEMPGAKPVAKKP